MLPKILRPLLTLALVSWLCSCGGDDDGVGGIDGSGSPIGSTAVSGPITGFGSVIVGGVHYKTENTSFLIKGKYGSESELNVGSYITLQGEVFEDIKNNKATTIYYQPTVSGPISSVDIANNSIVVLGQTVQINDETTFDFKFMPRDITGLSVQQKVEVSGVADAQGRIQATRIGLDSTPTMEIVGQISNLNTSAKTFTINQQEVDYSKVVSLPEGFGNGQRVVLHEGELVNAQLRPKMIDRGFIPAKGSYGLNGIVTRFNSLNDFEINNIPIVTTATTQYIGFDQPATPNITVGETVVIEGQWDASKLVVDKVGKVPPPETTWSGRITYIKELGSEGGVIYVDNQMVILNNTTRLDGEFASAENRMKFGHLTVGNYVKVKLRGSVAASLELESPTMATFKIIRGKPTLLNSSQGYFWIALPTDKVQITTFATTQFSDTSGPITPNTFYSSAPRTVEVMGNLNPNTYKMEATKIKIITY